MEFKIPQSLKAEHEELHSELARAIKSGGATGEAARAVENVLHSHFLKEEEYALPPLGLLRILAECEISEEMRPAITMADRLRSDMSRMLLEHKGVLTALSSLEEAANREDHPEFIRFAEDLALRARNEEEVLYPATVLIGEFLKLKLKSS